MGNKIKQNDYKMKRLAKEVGDAYFIMFGELIQYGYSIQDSIDMCYNYFFKEVNCEMDKYY